MTNIILGNAICLLAMLADSFSSSRKTTKGILLAQSAGQFFYGCSSFVLGGYSASVQNGVSIVRNFVAMGNKSIKAVEWGLVALGVVLGLYFNNMGVVGLIPVVANLQYSIAVFRFKDNERALKISFLVLCSLYAVFSIFIFNVVSVCSNLVVISSVIISLRKGKVQE